MPGTSSVFGKVVHFSAIHVAAGNSGSTETLDERVTGTQQCHFSWKKSCLVPFGRGGKPGRSWRLKNSRDTDNRSSQQGRRTRGAWTRRRCFCPSQFLATGMCSESPLRADTQPVQNENSRPTNFGKTWLSRPCFFVVWDLVLRPPLWNLCGANSRQNSMFEVTLARVNSDKTHDEPD